MCTELVIVCACIARLSLCLFIRICVFMQQMSILFDALNKAARDYRVQQTPVVVPLLSTRSVPFMKRRMMFVCALILALSAGCVIGAMTFGNVASDPLAPVIESQADFTADSDLVMSSREARRADDGDALGIELPEEALIAEIKDQAKVRKLAEKIKDAPAVTAGAAPAVAVRPSLAPKSFVVVENSAESLTKRTAFVQAVAAIGKKDWDAALKAYAKVLAFDSDDQDALQGTIFVHEQRGRPDDLTALEGMIKKNPSCAALYAARARIYARTKQTDLALRAWQRAVDLDPQNTDYKLGLAILYDRMGKRDEALQAYHAVPVPLPDEAQKRLDYLSEQSPDADSLLAITQLDDGK